MPRVHSLHPIALLSPSLSVRLLRYYAALTYSSKRDGYCTPGPVCSTLLLSPALFSHGRRVSFTLQFRSHCLELVLQKLV